MGAQDLVSRCEQIIRRETFSAGNWTEACVMGPVAGDDEMFAFRFFEEASPRIGGDNRDLKGQGTEASDRRDRLTNALPRLSFQSNQEEQMWVDADLFGEVKMANEFLQPAGSLVLADP